MGEAAKEVGLWWMIAAWAGEPGRIQAVSSDRPVVALADGTTLTFDPGELHERGLVALRVEPLGDRPKPEGHVGEIVVWEGKGPAATLSLPAPDPPGGSTWAILELWRDGWREAGGVVGDGRVSARVHPGTYARVRVPVATPAELLGAARTPDLAPGCTFRLGDHDDLRAPWLLDVTLSVPDADGMRWVLQTAIAPGRSGSELFPEKAKTAHALDLRAPVRDARSPGPVYWAPRPVDFASFPLEISFPAARFEDPTRVGAYRIVFGRGSDGNPIPYGDPFGTCANKLDGPGGVGGCTMVSGDCRSAYRAVHAERWSAAP